MQRIKLKVYFVGHYTHNICNVMVVVSDEADTHLTDLSW